MNDDSSDRANNLANCSRPNLKWDFSIELNQGQGVPSRLAVTMDKRRAVVFVNTSKSNYVEAEIISAEEALGRNIPMYETDLLIPPPIRR